MTSLALEVLVRGDVNGRPFEDEPGMVAATARRKYRAEYAGNFVNLRMLRVVNNPINSGMGNLVTRSKYVADRRHYESPVGESGSLNL